jgi:hypothetical protein
MRKTYFLLIPQKAFGIAVILHVQCKSETYSRKNIFKQGNHRRRDVLNHQTPSKYGEGVAGL